MLHLWGSTLKLYILCSFWLRGGTLNIPILSRFIGRLKNPNVGVFAVEGLPIKIFVALCLFIMLKISAPVLNDVKPTHGSWGSTPHRRPRYTSNLRKWKPQISINRASVPLLGLGMVTVLVFSRRFLSKDTYKTLTKHYTQQKYQFKNTNLTFKQSMNDNNNSK